jgi:hypothetical protein
VSTFSHTGPSFLPWSNGECYCTTDLGRTFSHPIFDKVKDATLFGDSKTFLIGEIEVYAKI